jgi:hypothetical protein
MQSLLNSTAAQPVKTLLPDLRLHIAHCHCMYTTYLYCCRSTAPPLQAQGSVDHQVLGTMAKSMGYNMAGGLQGMLKDGHTSFEGVDEAIMRNIDAAKQLADIVKTSLGPNGKLVCCFHCCTQCCIRRKR